MSSTQLPETPLQNISLGGRLWKPLDGKWPRCGRRLELLQAARHSYRIHVPTRDRKSFTTSALSTLRWLLADVIIMA